MKWQQQKRRKKAAASHNNKYSRYSNTAIELKRQTNWEWQSAGGRGLREKNSHWNCSQKLSVVMIRRVYSNAIGIGLPIFLSSLCLLWISVLEIITCMCECEYQCTACVCVCAQLWILFAFILVRWWETITAAMSFSNKTSRKIKSSIVESKLATTIPNSRAS